MEQQDIMMLAILNHKYKSSVLMPPLLIISICSPLFPLFIGIKNKTYTLLWFYPLTGFVFDVLISILKRGFVVNYQWPTNIFVLIEFLIISALYNEKIFKRNKIFYVYVVLHGLYFITRTISKSVLIFNMYDAGFFALSYIIYSILGFYTILIKQETIQLEKSAFFWLNIAFIVYASGVFFLFLFKEYFRKVNLELYLLLWGNIFCLLNTFKYILIGIALICLNKAPKLEHH
jgi:hypothetical protein